jgi:hypothetical protein
MIVEAGTRWDAGNGKTFVVLHVVEQDGNVWVHYRSDNAKENKEYSCYLESFVQRFRQLPE